VAKQNAVHDEKEYRKWVAEQIGPRKVGGRYRSGYDGGEYEVVGIDPGPRDTWPIWEITVRRTEGRRSVEVSHCTAWDPDRDEVLS
jgi:hypothetical protein